MAHIQLKFKTEVLQQDEVLADLPKAIRTSISQHLFHETVDSAYLFNGVSQDFIMELVTIFQAQVYFIKFYFSRLLDFKR